MRKCEVQEKELQNLESSIDQRKTSWGKLMFKGGAKEALIEDIEKSYKESYGSSEILIAKMAEITHSINSLEEISKCMETCPDYELRKASLKKLQDALEDLKKKRDEFSNDLKGINSEIQKLKEAKDKGLQSLPLDNLQQLAKIGEDLQDLIAKSVKKSD